MAWAVCACACVRLGWAGMGEREDTSDRSCVARKTGRVPGNRPLIDYEALALECSYHANWREKEKARSLQTLWLQLHGDEPRARSQQQRERQRHQSRLPGFWGPPVQSFLPSGEESRTLRRHVDPSADWTLGSHRGPLLENGRAAEPGGKVGVWGVGAATGGRDIPLLQALVPRCTSCTLHPWIPPSMDSSIHGSIFSHRPFAFLPSSPSYNPAARQSSRLTYRRFTRRGVHVNDRGPPRPTGPQAIAHARAETWELGTARMACRHCPPGADRCSTAARAGGSVAPLLVEPAPRLRSCNLIPGGQGRSLRR